MSTGFGNMQFGWAEQLMLLSHREGGCLLSVLAFYMSFGALGDKPAIKDQCGRNDKPMVLLSHFNNPDTSGEPKGK